MSTKKKKKKLRVVISFSSDFLRSMLPLPPPPPPDIFPNYPSPSSSSATPFPPPSMPPKSFFRRWLPLVLLGSGACLFMNSQRHLIEARKAALEDLSFPVQITDDSTS